MDRGQFGHLRAQRPRADGTIAKVAFYRNGVPITTLTQSPYSFTWTGVPAGSYMLSADVLYRDRPSEHTAGDRGCEPEPGVELG